jgi:DNA-directed RNA polymerase subunit RPC12/RpoP
MTDSPLSSEVVCTFCGKEISRPRAYRYVEAFEQVGGDEPPVILGEHDAYACQRCVAERELARSPDLEHVEGNREN